MVPRMAAEANSRALNFMIVESRIELILWILDSYFELSRYNGFEIDCNL